MELLVAGKILGTHNLKGEVKVISSIDNLEKLIGEKLMIELDDSYPQLLTIKDVKHFVQNKWIFQFVEIKNKQDATKLRNATIKVRRDLLGISEDEFLISDMIGLKVIDINKNQEIGIVNSIMETAAHDIYVVNDEEYETLIPDVDVFIKEVNMEKRIIYVDLYDGMREKIKK